jgi:4-hydroxy-4-methyl-2-oxoglutarate aldolase
MNEHVVYRRVARAHPALVARAADCPMSDLYEALAPDRRRLALMTPRMRPLVSGLRIAGPAVTVRCPPGDNLMLHQGLVLAQAGDVLVVSGGEPSAAQWGMLAAVYAERIGLAGVVVHGCIRDVDDLMARRYPVWCTEISPSHPEKQAAGSVNAPIECGGATVIPGDVISADGDGVLVIRPDELASAVAGAEERQRHETAGVAEINAGRRLFDVHGLEAALRDSGVREIDDVWKP